MNVMRQRLILSLILILHLATTGEAQSVKKIKAPDFSLKTYEGKTITLSKLKGRVVIVNFWATWCPPCRAEIPDFIDVYKTYRSKGLEIIGVALDVEGWSKVRPFVEDQKINYSIVLGDTIVEQQYGGIRAVPTTFAVDRDGYIVAAQEGMLTKGPLEQKVKTLLSIPKPVKQETVPTLSTAKQVNVGAKLSTDKIQVGSTIQLAVQLKINKGWHINSHEPTFNYLIGTTFELEQKEGVIITDLQYPKGKLVSLSFAEQPINVYEGTTTIFASIKISNRLSTGKDTLKGKVIIQACNDQYCIAPSTIKVDMPVQIVGIDEAVTKQNQDLFADYHPSELSSIKTDNTIAMMFEKRGSFLAFFAIFLIGLALNLTPCVYPMLSVTVSLFGSQSETTVTRVFLKAVVYVLGIATMYSILGVTAALGGGLFGSWLQSPYVLAGIAVLLFALALSSFGLYQIQMPYWLTSRLGGTTGRGFIALFLSGLVVGVFAAPCVGPPVIALLTFVASKGSVTFGFWVFFTLALGLGFPYLILGTFSGLLKKIPKSGSWLVWVEHIFGVILIGAALFYLFLAIAPKEALYIIPLALVVGGIYLGFIDNSGKEKPFLKNIQRMVGIVAILAGILYTNSMRDKGMAWDSYSDINLEEAKENGIPVLLDFYADWCIPCIELDRNTWTDAEVIKATKDIKRLKVDLTQFDSGESEALRKKFNISGVPTIIFIRMDGTEATDSRIIGFASPEEFLSKLKQVMSEDQ
jgi:thiol:disulfide interchange protein DsbD